MEAPSLGSIVWRTFFSTLISCSVISLLWLEMVELSANSRRNDFYGLGHVMLVFCAFCMALSTFTIFLNRNRVIRTNGFFSWLTFFLPPVLIAIFLEITLFDGDELRLFAVMLLAFLVPLFYYFLQYRKQQG